MSSPESFGTLSIFLCQRFMNARAKSSASLHFGNSFSDGKSAKVGGLAYSQNEPASRTSVGSAWNHSSAAASISPNTPLNPTHYKIDPGQNSVQKRGAARTHNPGDLSKPLFLKRVLMQPLLTDIKREYEVMIEHLKQDLNAFEITKSKLSVMEYQKAKEVQQVIDDHKLLLREMTASSHELKKQLETKNLEIYTLQKSTEQLQFDLKKATQMKPHESPELVELRRIAADFEEFERKTKDTLGSKEQQISDLLTYKKRLQAELVESTTQMSKLKSSVAGLSKEALQHMETDLKEARDSLARAESDKLAAVAQTQNLERLVKETRQQIQKSKLSALPDWEYIQGQFTPSIKPYWDLCKKMDYNDAIVTLVRELLKKPKSASSGSAQPTGEDPQPLPNGATGRTSDDEYFAGKGIHAAIPKFLRTKQKVLNRKLSRQSTLLLVKDVWEAKLVYDAAQVGTVTSLPDFLYLYLKKRFGNQEVLCEWGYNLQDACNRYKDMSVDCMYFGLVLSQELDESVFRHLKLLVERLKNEVYRWDVTSNFGKSKGFLDKTEFAGFLAQYYPAKSQKQLAALVEALGSDQPGDVVIYRFLFEAEGDSAFLECLKKQILEDRLEYIRKLEEGIRKMSRDDTMSVFEASRILKEKDPSKSKLELDAYIARGFRCKVEDLIPKKVVSKKDFLKNIQFGILVLGPHEGQSQSIDTGSSSQPPSTTAAE
ncbi:Translin-associated factor X-interacting protein 1 [Kappamyces sp. JEL0680]|nr:Translin-associated factor X-interacting protein 1 [Kappamyces sp. JEL0680]